MYSRKDQRADASSLPASDISDNSPTGFTLRVAGSGVEDLNGTYHSKTQSYFIKKGTYEGVSCWYSIVCDKITVWVQAQKKHSILYEITNRDDGPRRPPFNSWKAVEGAEPTPIVAIVSDSPSSTSFDGSVGEPPMASGGGGFRASVHTLHDFYGARGTSRPPSESWAQAHARDRAFYGSQARFGGMYGVPASVPSSRCYEAYAPSPPAGMYGAPARVPPSGFYGASASSSTADMHGVPAPVPPPRHYGASTPVSFADMPGVPTPIPPFGYSEATAPSSTAEMHGVPAPVPPPRHYGASAPPSFADMSGVSTPIPPFGYYEASAPLSAADKYGVRAPIPPFGYYGASARFGGMPGAPAPVPPSRFFGASAPSLTAGMSGVPAPIPPFGYYGASAPWSFEDMYKLSD